MNATEEMTKATYMHDITLAHNGKRYQVYRYNVAADAFHPMFLVGSKGEFVELIGACGKPNTYGASEHSIRTRGRLQGMPKYTPLGYVELHDGKIVNPAPIVFGED